MNWTMQQIVFLIKWLIMMSIYWRPNIDTPEEIEEVRSDAIIATGRSDYPNQVNNLIGFPYIF